MYSERGNLSEVRARALCAERGRAWSQRCAAPAPSPRAQVLCKPKILPIKSVTLEKLEEMEKQAAALAQQAVFGGVAAGAGGASGAPAAAAAGGAAGAAAAGTA